MFVLLLGGFTMWKWACFFETSATQPTSVWCQHPERESALTVNREGLKSVHIRFVACLAPGI
jgi:hypothetical protein